MSANIDHELKVSRKSEETSRQHFVKGMRSYILNDLAGHMKTVWENKTEPKFEKETIVLALRSCKDLLYVSFSNIFLCCSLSFLV